MKKDLAKHVISLVLFGLNGIIASRISVNSYDIVLTRTALGSLFLVALFLLTKNKFTFFKHKKSLLFLALSGISMGFSWMCLYSAYARIGVSIATLTYYFGPIIVIMLSPLLFKEKLTPFKLIGFALVLAGVILINANFSGEKINAVGVTFAILSAVTYSLMVIFNKKATAIEGLENATLQLVISFITVAIFVGIKQGFNIPFVKGDILPVLVLGLINTGLGCYLYFTSIGSLNASTVSVCGYIEPLCAVLFSVLLLGENMSVIQIIGAVLIIGGAIVAERLSFKRKRNDNQSCDQQKTEV